MSENRPQMTAQSAVAVAVAVVDVEQGEKVLRVIVRSTRWSTLCAWHTVRRARKCSTCSASARRQRPSCCVWSAVRPAFACSTGSDTSFRCDTRDAVSRSPFRSRHWSRWHSLLTAADEEQKEVSPDARDRAERRLRCCRSRDGARLHERRDGCGAQGRRTRRYGDLGARHRGKRSQALFRHRDTGGKGNCFPLLSKVRKSSRS